MTAAANTWAGDSTLAAALEANMAAIERASRRVAQVRGQVAAARNADELLEAVDTLAGARAALDPLIERRCELRAALERQRVLERLDWPTP